MNAHKELLGGLLLASIVASCGTGNNSQISEGLDNCPVVGTFVEAGSNKVLSCDQKLLTDTVFLPLSHLTEELEVNQVRQPGRGIGRTKRPHHFRPLHPDTPLGTNTFQAV